MQSLFQKSIMNGRVLCGAACFHTYTLCYCANYLKHLLKNPCKNNSLSEIIESESSPKSFVLTLIKQLKKVFINYLKCLLERDLDEYKIDTESGHLFYSNNKKLKCECGLFELKNADDFGLIELSDDFSLIEGEILLSYNEHSLRLAKKEETLTIIDCHESKVNCFKIARDIISSIHRIGVLVYN